MKPSRDIARLTDEMLDARQRARLLQLNGIERLIVRKLLSEMRDALEEKDGVITSRLQYSALAKRVDAVFDAVQQKGLGDLGAQLVNDMKGVLKFNSDYNKSLQAVKGGQFKAIRAAVDAAMRKRLGIDSEDAIRPKGYLAQLFNTRPSREEVAKMVAKLVAAKIPMRKFERALRVKVAGTKDTQGVLEKHLGGFVLDTYQVADSITNNEFAKRMGLRYFIYSGGLIETSREFCRKRNNKVFTTEEAAKWPDDPTLPRTKAEADSGVLTDYVPLEDRGRWRCRHRLLYIPEEEAFRRRPELRPKA